MKVIREKPVLGKKAVMQLEEELSKLLKVTLPKIAKQLQEAREFGDLRENAEFTSARNDQGIAQNRVEEIRNILSNYIPEEEAGSYFDGKHITYNVKVKYVEVDDPKKTVYVVKIVSKYEANPLDGKISSDSPLGQSLWLRKKGDEIYVKGEIDEPYKIKILDVSI